VKLTDEQVRHIRTAGLPDSQLATKYRRTIGTIRDARVGKTYRDHPTPPDTKPRGQRNRGDW
jgi:hypothetical protein